MATIGFVILVFGFVYALGASACLIAGFVTKAAAPQRIGHTLVFASGAALLTCCILLIWCFMTGDVSILYVLENRSLSTDRLGWLYRLSGLWAGRSGSLLFWAMLMAVYNCIVAGKASRSTETNRIDTLAIAIISVVIAAFCCILLFSEGNMPFEATPQRFFDDAGALVPQASSYSMNQLLEHWAMAIHPPLLFAGYAGLVVPFAYAVAALVAGDFSRLWVERIRRFVLVSWLFLGAGIGLGSVWAYVVLGWGGYWGWDPVENASLLSWLVCVALVHSMTVYRTRGALKRWTVACAGLSFTFVIVATFITRSGIVESVHAFAGDAVSLVVFGLLIIVSVAAIAIGIALRWKSLDADSEGGDDIESLASKDAAYYFNNVIMLVMVLLFTYMTLAPALPSWMPFGGSSLSSSSYEAVARPVGIVYLFILAVCPLLGWGGTDRGSFLRQVRIPAIGATVLFIALVAWWATNLAPVYDAVMGNSDATSLKLLEAGPKWYYQALAVAGLLVASLLLFNAALMFIRNIRTPRKRGAAIGGSLAHVAMAVILIGLIGSNMYVYERSGYLSDAEGEAFAVGEYELVYAGDSVDDRIDSEGSVIYQVDFDVYKNGRLVGQAHPSVQLDVTTQQRKLNASVISFPEEDLFVVYRGVNQNDDFSLDVRINPLVSLVWIGFGMLMLGTFAAAVMPRRREPSDERD